METITKLPMLMGYGLGIGALFQHHDGRAFVMLILFFTAMVLDLTLPSRRQRSRRDVRYAPERKTWN